MALFGNKKNKKEVSYVIKSVTNPRVSPQKLRKSLLVGAVIFINFAFLAGFTSYFARYSSNLSEFTSSLNPLATNTLNTTNLPTATRSGLGLVSDSEDLFPQVNLSESELTSEFSLEQGEAEISLPKILNTNWEIVGTGDFNSDKELDYVLQNKTNNLAVVWFGEASKVSRIRNLPTINDNRWEISAVEDFNKDGNTDILWTYEDEGVAKRLIWFMRNTQILKQQWLVLDLEKSKDWKVVGTGDFDGNSIPDIVLSYKGRNVDFKGANLVNFLEGTDTITTKKTTTTAWLPWIENKDEEGNPTKDLVKVVDFNKDGFFDLVLRQNSFSRVRSEQGTTEVWLMKDTDKTATIELARSLDLTWEINFADLNRDSATDILWTNNDPENQSCQGKTTIWLMGRIERLKTVIQNEITDC